MVSQGVVALSPELGVYNKSALPKQNYLSKRIMKIDGVQRYFLNFLHTYTCITTDMQNFELLFLLSI